LFIPYKSGQARLDFVANFNQTLYIFTGGHIQFRPRPEFYHTKFLAAADLPALGYLADYPPGNSAADLPDKYPVIGAVGPDQAYIIGLVDLSGARIHSIFISAFFVDDALDPRITRGAVDVHVEDAQEYPDSHRRSADEAVLFYDLDIRYPAVRRRQ
jgi:hypothetical protein